MLNYRLFTKEDIFDPINKILIGRGIPKNNINKWLKASMADVEGWRGLGEDIVRNAVHRLKKACDSRENISIVVDSDVDGFTSSAIIINYIYKRWQHMFDEGLVKYYLHSGKQHGLNDVLSDIELMPAHLVITPDAATNDYEAHERLLSRGTDVIILDHHECDYVSDCDNVYTINNQTSGYTNKTLSGAGITWLFCKALDELLFEDEIADEFLDICALGCLSDMMDYRNVQTKAIIDAGLSRIRNPFFYTMVQKNKYSIDTKKGGINYMSMAFYVTPFINAINRSGLPNEKMLVFESMCYPYCYNKIESGKRGASGTFVPIYEEAARIAANVKIRQTNLQNDGISKLKSKIVKDNLLDNEVLLIKCEPGDVEKNIAGLVANKFQSEYQKPCMILIKTKTATDKEYFYRGSARNFSMSEIEDFRGVLQDTNLCEYAQGHSGACGVSVAESNVDALIEMLNDRYKDINTEPVYWVDYIWTPKEVSTSTIISIAENPQIYGQGIGESKICIKDVKLKSCSITLMGVDKGKPTLKIVLPGSNMSLIKFNATQEEFDMLTSSNGICTFIIAPKKNEWMGKVSAQGEIETYDIEESKWIF